MGSRRTLGVGFFPSDPYLYFDKQKFLTFGNGDPLFDGGEVEINFQNPHKSEFLAIFETIIFYTEQSESNTVILVTRKRRDYTKLLGELFPDYEFYFFSPDYSPDETGGNTHYDHHLNREDFLYLNPIIFCEDITFTNYMDMKPYLVMGVFEIPEDGKYEFYDGILLRPIYGDKVRLLIKGVSYRVWDRKVMEKTLLHHLSVVRHKYRFFDPVTGERTQECRYDQIAEKYLKLQYLKKVNLTNDNLEELDEMFRENSTFQ